MKKIIAVFGLIALLAIPAKAQTDTNNPASSMFSGVLWDSIKFLATDTTNWFGGTAGLYDAKDKTGGADLFLGYNASSMLAVVLRGEWFDGGFSLVSGNVQLQAPLRILGKFDLIPILSAGIATPLAIGNSTAHSTGEVIGVFDAGGAVRLGKGWDIFGGYEKRTGYSGGIVFFGVLKKF